MSAAAPSSTPLPELPGYRIVGRVGAGGMGVVYRAIQTSLQREVALKVLADEISGSPRAAANFLREARIAAQISHPNVITVYDVAQHERTVFMAMEYIPGGDAWTAMQQKGGALPAAEALALARDATKGLAAIHEAKLLHRDIKPQNIFIHRHGAKLGDLGLARQADRDDARPNATLGTPQYMSPEQARGDTQLDIRSDIYAIGATLYCMLTGQPPFDGPNAWAVVSAVLKDPLPDIRVRSRVPVGERLAELVERCLARDPLHRYQDPDELLAALRDLEAAPLSDAFGRPHTQVISGRLGARRQTADSLELPDTPVVNNVDTVAGSVAAALRATTLDQPCYQPPGTIVGPYRLRAAIGESATGFVYRAVEIEGGRPVRLELVRPEYNNDSGFTQRLSSLSARLAMLPHPNLTHLSGAEEHVGQWCIVHELAGERSLAEVIATEGRMGWEEAVTLVRECLDGLEALHEIGVVHRAIEPGSILLDRDHAPHLGPVAFDAALGAPNLRKTESGAYLVAMAHYSPEQVLGEREPGPASDIYALGATLFTLLTGRTPFAADSAFDLYHAIIADSPAPLRSLVADLPDPVYAVVDKAMARKAEDRYRDCAAFRRDLLVAGVGLKLKERLRAIGNGSLATDDSVKDLLTLRDISAPGDPDLEGLKRAAALVALRAQSIPAWQALAHLYEGDWVGEKAAISADALASFALPPCVSTLTVGGAGAEYRSITAAVAAAAPGSRLLISPGVYDEQVVVDRDLLLIADGASGQVTIRNATATPLTIIGARVVLSRIVTRCEQAAATDGSRCALLVHDGRLLAHNATMVSTAQVGLQVRGENAEAILLDCRINQNAGVGAAFNSGARGMLHHCDASENALHGIALTDRCSVRIAFSRIHANGGNGINLRDLSGGSIEDCVIAANQKPGVLVRKSGVLRLERNRIHSNGAQGVALGDGGRAILSACEIANNKAAGILVVGGADPLVQQCQLLKNRGEGIAIGAGGRGRFEQCTISANMGAGLSIAAGGQPTVVGGSIEHGRAIGLAAEAGALGMIEGVTFSGDTAVARQLQPGSKVHLR